MPTKYTGRIFLILAIVFIAVIAIFPPETLFQPGLSFRERLNLKPGIDMVGGISLIYKIQAPPGKENDPDLAETVEQALQRRVDPDGVRNLVWRPIGSDELEIEMPQGTHSKQAEQDRTDYNQAKAELQTLSVSQTEVMAALKLPPAQRDARLKELAGNDPQRRQLFSKLVLLSTQISKDKVIAADPKTPQAQMNRVLDELASDEEQYTTLTSQIEAHNVDAATLESTIDDLADDPQKLQAQVDTIVRQLAGYPRGQQIVKNFVAKYQAYSAVKAQLDDAADLKELLQGSGVLEFHILAYDQNDPLYKTMFDRMKPDQPAGQGGPLPRPGDKYRWFMLDNQGSDDVQKMIHSGDPIATWNDKYYALCLVTPDASMLASNDWHLERAYPAEDDSGASAVGFEFDTRGGELFGQLTTRWQPKDGHSYGLATILDNRLITAPNINEPITQGQGIITGGSGGFSQNELNYLIETLNAGSLPAKLADQPISEHNIGPAIGKENLIKGLTACGFGLVVVAVFLISYYYVAGLVAFLAILLNIVLILGVLAAFGATFTLPSIAGIVLTVGTSVDANVLVFERLREEQHRGLGLRMALRNSYDRAFSAIVDSNMTSMITSICLYAFGSEEVKGFGLTLIIGILCSLFTALYVTKTVFGIMIDKFGMKNLSSLPLTFPKWDKLLKPNIDWMGLAWIFYSFSIVAITSGLIFFGYYSYKGEMLDIEFAGGTSVDFNIAATANHPVWTADEVRDLLGKVDPNILPSPSVLRTGDEQDGSFPFEVVTSSYDTSKVTDAITATLGKYMKLQLPSTFTGSSDTGADKAMAQHVLFPIPVDLSQWPSDVDGWKVPPVQAQNYLGGVAIQLDHLSPQLTAAQIMTRISNSDIKIPNQQNLENILVIVPPSQDSSRPTSTALVLMNNSSIAYSADPQSHWIDQMAQPAWTLVSSALQHKPSMVAVNSFSPSVAGAACDAALIALTLSVLVIMAYIWFRFGNFKYGTATVIALMHDTVFTLAALGFAHLLSGSKIGDLLELEPFRINMTVVAGILTIMSYSMIDTIVVFDRIRENRGKYGHLSRKIVNDAINQTLSRTLLTAGTTTITVAFMFFLGGEGIHGFTFVLLIGILVGTYSSVAIAAPLLLIGKDVTRDVPEAKAQGRLPSAA
ncbi:MAG TPA: protein translocase subunit SecD [Tepidisphaeraceae bacterium]|nr:protein translocase subunit SecD [Tepidisphaeraceae bacterium]